jgi:5-hydroxybenzimidazole synthase
MSTQVELATQGIITPTIQEIAAQEGHEPETIRQRIADGQIAAPLNANRPCRVVGIGMGLRSKVNASEDKCGPGQFPCAGPSDGRVQDSRMRIAR